MWQRDSPHCPVGHQRLEPRNRSGLDVLPWQPDIPTLARKVKQMGRFFSFSPEDAAQLQRPSLPGEKTSLKGEERGAGGGRLDWTGLKHHSSLHQKGSRPGHPAPFAAASGPGQLRVAPQSGRRCVQAPLRAPNAAEAFVCFPLRMSLKGPLIFIHIP